MRFDTKALILSALLLLAPSWALAQQTASFAPTALPASLSVTTVTARVVFASPGPTALIVNTGLVPAYLNFGSVSVTATTSGYLLGAGCSMAYNVSGQTYVAAITASSTTTLKITTGSGLPTLPPNNCTQTVTVTTGTVTSDQGVANAGGTLAWPVISQPSAVANSGVAPVVSSAAEACHVLKSGAGNLYTLSLSITTVSGYVLIFNATSAPVDGAVTPVWWQVVNSNGTFGGLSAAWPASAPLYNATGTTVCFSSTGPFTKTSSATASFSGGVK